MMSLFSPHIKLAHSLWKGFLHPHDHAIDATAGNGHDTLKLLQLLPFGHVYVFDIQEKALNNTRERLQKHSLEKRVSFFPMSHESFSHLPPEKIRLVVYNLGYLPGGDKRITTLCASTQKSIQQALLLIEKNQGAISITCYPGHSEGKKEEELLLQELKQLDFKQWHVSFHQWINRSSSPSLFWIESKKNGLQ